MKFDTTDPMYQELLARVLRSDTPVVPFVGSGVSVYGEPSQRLPLWRELLDRLCAEGRRLGLIPAAGDPVIESALRSGRYIEATDRILDALGEPTFRRVVERELDTTDKPIPPAISELVAIGWSLIVTTNLDRLIARAYLERYGRPLNAITSLDTHKLAAALAGTLTSKDTSLAQIHGDLDVYPSWRLTRAHYEMLLRDPGYVEALKHLFLRQVFFVGFGLQDDDFDFLLATVAQVYPAGVGEFYALIDRARKHDPVIQDLIRHSGLRPIFYDVDPGPSAEDPFGGHRAVYECLEHLAISWAATTTGLEVTLKYFAELDQSMIRRDREIDRLSELVETDRGGVVQVVGLGGAGKTSLVQQYLAERKAPLATAGYRRVFGCSFYRADIGQFIHDMASAVGGSDAVALPQRVDRICHEVSAKRTLVILDGLEAVIDAEAQLRNPYVLQIIDSVLAGDGAVIVTTRVPVRGGMLERAPSVEITPLSVDEILQFLEDWGLDALGDAAQRRLVEVTGGHPLALRILAGVLQEVPVQDAVSTIERSPVIDVSDEVDPLRENRLARILGSYVHHLDKAEVAFLDCSTVFDRPVGYQLFEAALARPYPDTTVNAPLRDVDLRVVVRRLLNRRLLTAGSRGELSSHPTVREYFARHTRESGESLVPIHRFLAGEVLRAAASLPETFEEAIPLMVACRHAAACEDWTLFDDLFRRRLMRGFRNHLCNNLGAWEEALAIARMGDVSSFPAASTPEPAFYPITVARCLKHLGRSAESRTKYVKTLKASVASRDSDTAKYVNNLLTLLVWRGELAAADRLAELNVRALSWISERWKHRWQAEHGFSTFGYLRMLRGSLDSAALLFEHAARAWDGYDGERLWVYDYYPYHRSELILLNDPTAHDAALAGIEALLTVAHAHGWPESICRGYIQAAVVQIDRAGATGNAVELIQARYRLEQARAIATGMVVPDVAIAHSLAQIHAELVHRAIHQRADLDHADLTVLVKRIDGLIATSGLALAMPELTAARGMLSHLSGATDAARTSYERALRQARDQGNALAPRSGRSLVNWLGNRLGETVQAAPTALDVDLIGLTGAPLTSDWMTAQLDQLETYD
jgi:hypothetical protein